MTMESGSGAPRTDANLDKKREGLERQSEAHRQWESDILVRSAALVAVLQGLIGAAAATFPKEPDDQVMLVSLALLTTGCAIASAWVRVWRLVPWFACIAALLVAATHLDRRWINLADGQPRTMPIGACLLYSAMGVLVMRRSRLGRDLLMAIAGTWVLALLPEVLVFLFRTSTLTARELRSFGLILTFLIPPLLVCAVLVSRSGRSLFAPMQAREPLARLTSLVSAPRSARAWATVLTIPLTCIGSIAFLREFGELLRQLF